MVYFNKGRVERNNWYTESATSGQSLTVTGTQGHYQTAAFETWKLSLHRYILV